MRIALPEHVRGDLDGRLPDGVTAVYYGSGQEALQAVQGAEIAWLDIFSPPGVGPVIEAATEVRWITTLLAGVNNWPLQAIKARGLPLTNGAGINAIPVAEFAVMGVLAMAKNLRELIHAQDRREWVQQVPGTGELYGSKALVIGYGSIGREIGQRLRGFGVDVTGVRRTPAGEADVIGPQDWRARLGEFDWIVLAAAATGETTRMIGREELGRMKPSAHIVNIARGDLIDQAALIEAVTDRTIAGAFLDVTSPEPALPDDPIWTAPNVVMTSHASGRAQTRATERAAALFLENLASYQGGRPLRNLVDLDLGY